MTNGPEGTEHGRPSTVGFGDDPALKAAYQAKIDRLGDYGDPKPLGSSALVGTDGDLKRAIQEGYADYGGPAPVQEPEALVGKGTGEYSVKDAERLAELFAQRESVESKLAEAEKAIMYYSEYIDRLNVSIAELNHRRIEREFGPQTDTKKI